MAELEERVGKVENRLTRIETEIPHLKESIDKNTQSHEKMIEALNNLGKTMENINFTTNAQQKEITENKEEIGKVKIKVEELEEKGKFDISNWIKSNWPWLLITATLAIGLVSNLFKF